MISKKPYKIRNMTMKNFVDSISGSASKNSLNNSAKDSVKSPMLNWESEGGGGRMWWRVKNG
jgi:hypothetical protein